MGDVVSSIGGLFGAGGDPVGQAQFNPFDASSALGRATFSDGSADVQLSPELQRVYGGLLRQAPGQFQQAQSPQAALGFLSGQFAPQFERQQASQESRLFNQGLLGTTTGQLQSQGLREAQNQALVNSALQAQNQAFQRGQGLLGSALNIGQAPMGLAQLGANLGQADLQTQQINLGLQEQAQQRQADFFSSIISGGIGAATGFSGGGGSPTLPSSIFSGAGGNAPGSVPTAGQFALGARIPSNPYAGY